MGRDKNLETEEGAMNGIILFGAAAVATYWLFVQALNATKTNPARARVSARRPNAR